MRCKIANVMIAAAGMYLLCPGTTRAAEMMCSGEHGTCVSSCMKIENRSLVPTCLVNCRARQITCLQTGCWDNGSVNYCGLSRR